MKDRGRTLLFTRPHPGPGTDLVAPQEWKWWESALRPYPTLRPTGPAPQPASAALVTSRRQWPGEWLLWQRKPKACAL